MRFMPVLHAVMAVLLFNQWSFYLKTYDFMSKLLQLVYRGIADSIGFILLYMIFLLLFMFIFHVLGATFDDGD